MERLNDKISVIVPVYNVENYVADCIESICAQTYVNIEILLVDDGSTDESGKICESYAKKDERIRVIHKKNGGLSDARNAGIREAVGKWYTFIDSDDYIALDAIERLYHAAVSTKSDLAISNMTRVYEDGEKEIFYKPYPCETVLKGNDRFLTLKQPSVCNKLFRAELFKDVLFPKGKYYEDTFVYHILIYRANQAVCTGAEGYFYRERRGSILDGEKYNDKYFDAIEAVYKRYTYLLKHKVEYYSDEACLSMYRVVANAEKYINKTADNKKKFEAMRLWYQGAYVHLMHESDEIGIKQKIRLGLLRYAPKLHARIF